MDVGGAMEAPTALCAAFDEYAESGVRNNCLRGVQWSPDGACLLTASEDNHLRIFNLPADAAGGRIDNDGGAARGTAREELRVEVDVREGDSIYDYCWYPLMDSSEPGTCAVVSASRDHPTHLWDAYDGRLRASYAAYNHLDEVVAAHSAVFEPSGARLYCGFERCIRIFDVCRPGRQCETRPTAATRKAREGQRGIISTIAFAPDWSGLYAAGSFGGTVGLYAESAPGCIAVLGGHTGGVTQLRFSPDGRHLFSGARRDGRILCWDVRNTCTVLGAYERAAPTNQRIGFDVTSDGGALITASADGRVLAFDVRAATSSEDGTAGGGSDGGVEPAVLLTHADATSAAELHPSLNLLAVSVGQRHFDRTRGGGGRRAKRRAVAEAEGESDESSSEGAVSIEENGFVVWRLPQLPSGDAAGGGSVHVDDAEDGAGVDASGPDEAAGATGVRGGADAAPSGAAPGQDELEDELDRARARLLATPCLDLS